MYFGEIMLKNEYHIQIDDYLAIANYIEILKKISSYSINDSYSSLLGKEKFPFISSLSIIDVQEDEKVIRLKSNIDGSIGYLDITDSDRVIFNMDDGSTLQYIEIERTLSDIYKISFIDVGISLKVTNLFADLDNLPIEILLTHNEVVVNGKWQINESLVQYKKDLVDFRLIFTGLQNYFVFLFRTYPQYSDHLKLAVIRYTLEFGENLQTIINTSISFLMKNNLYVFDILFAFDISKPSFTKDLKIKPGRFMICFCLKENKNLDWEKIKKELPMYFKSLIPKTISLFDLVLILDSDNVFHIKQ